MKAIMVMFDTLTRDFLPPYGCDWVHAPNFRRLAERSVTFDRSYVCSMPCMPARRDMHTGRPNFLHRSWGPLEPFDDSMPELLKEAGVYTHLASDHYHYWEDGGATYHGRYNTWECLRGQEGDFWKGQVADPVIPDGVMSKANADSPVWRQDWINRQFMQREQDLPQPKTFAAGLDFIDRNAREDNWFLQIETFDPHEPFFTLRKYKDLYAEHYDRYREMGGGHFDWPPYRAVEESPEEVEHARAEYAALISMCDAYLGDVMEAMDRHGLWEDTMLVVWTDHGFLLNEHECWGKSWVPLYEEIGHTPFFMWDPRSGRRGERCDALVQPAIDLGPTLLEYFGQEIPTDMTGKSLKQTLADGREVREAAIFGHFGGHIHITDGRYVYMRAPDPERDLYEYTLMTTRMKRRFTPEEAQQIVGLAEPFSFTKGCQTLKIAATNRKRRATATLLFDLEEDPKQERPFRDEAIEARLMEQMGQLMAKCDAPSEQYERVGLDPAEYMPDARRAPAAS